METSYKLIKVITNNVVKALDINGKEVILTGKGVGFHRSRGDIIAHNSIEHLFVMENDIEQKYYHELIMNTSPKIIDFANELIMYIQSQVNRKLNEHIHIALTDHITFLVRRCKMGIPLENPNVVETEIFYPKEACVAKEVVKRIRDTLNIDVPEGEVSFITLHIVSSITNTSLSNTKKLSAVLTKLTKIIEAYTMTSIDNTSLNYARLVSHLQFLIERTKRHEVFQIPVEVEQTLQREYPKCFDLAYKLIKIIEHEMNVKIEKNETAYLAIHLYRFGVEL